MSTWEEIKEANENIKTTDIKGKDYAEVNQRIKAFRMVHPDGQIITSIDKLGGGLVLMSARAIDEKGNILGTGHAYEKESSSYINKTSFIENCETSAVGRALGMAGFGIDTSVASKEEVENAIEQQEEIKAEEKAAKKGGEKITKTHLKALQKRCEDSGIPEGFILSAYNVEKLEDLTFAQFTAMSNGWEKVCAAYAKSVEES